MWGEREKEKLVGHPKERISLRDLTLHPDHRPLTHFVPTLAPVPSFSKQESHGPSWDVGLGGTAVESWVGRRGPWHPAWSNLVN